MNKYLKRVDMNTRYQLRSEIKWLRREVRRKDVFYLEFSLRGNRSGLIMRDLNLKEVVWLSNPLFFEHRDFFEEELAKIGFVRKDLRENFPEFGDAPSDREALFCKTE